MGGKKDTRLAYYRVDAKTVLKELRSSRDGLSHSDQIERLKRYGQNRLQEVHKESVVHKYLRQYKDLMILLLAGCALISFATGDSRTGIVLLALVLFNTIIGFTQEFKAEKLMDSLEKLIVSSAKIVRDGRLAEISAFDLVPGDIVYIEEGDSIPADLRLIEETELATNDFALTGESSPSRKFTHAIQGEVALANRHNLVFMGTTVALGHAYGVVVGTGAQTELGRIASLSSDTAQDVSPLQRELNHIAKRVTQGTIVLCVLLLPVAMRLGSLSFRNALLFAIGIASSIIPQGLPAEINTALAQAANKLAKTRALVKKLSAVETLGATSIICTDKTGTLTKNEMTVEQIFIGGSTYHVSGTGYETNGTISERGKKLTHDKLTDLSLFFTCGTLASNARVNPPDDEHATWYCLGDPTEGALVTLARKAGLDPLKIDEESPELKEFSFDSARKRMSSIRHYGPHRQIYVFVKGAPENVLEKCEEIWINGHVRKLTVADQAVVLKQHKIWAHSAMRNLAYAYKVLPAGTDPKKIKMEDAEKNLTFMGLVSMIDPLREEVPAAMRAAHAAHIKISIITGDFAPTAQAIAIKAGLALNHQDILVVTGDELKSLDNARVLQLVTRGSIIFSRVAPEDKLRIVDLVKNSGKIVAVTGDGINDAPALKRADIGVAMGRTGTDVAKQSAEIILLDDSFKTLVGAIQQGRVIYENIKKATLSVFSGNFAELTVNLTSLVAISAFGIPLALHVMELLAIDLIAELFPVAALGWDPANREVMAEQPRDPKHHILNQQSVPDVMWSGLIIGALAFTNYILFFWRHGIAAGHADSKAPLIYASATSMTYLTIVLCQLANILQRRSSEGLFTRYQLHNKQLWLALGFSLFCVSNIIYNPVVAPYFGAGSLKAVDWFFAIVATAIFIGMRELQRYANKHHSRETIIDLYHQTFTHSHNPQ
ncbi:MAG: cation-transporting P-type ATPase [Candidatus Saccharimonadales bacterium]